MGSTVYPAAGGGVTPKVATFTSTGTFTAPANTQYVEVFLVGGGGGGGGAFGSSSQAAGGGGGGGGVVNWRKLPVTGGTAYTVTIGAGGAGVASGATGVGGDTSFGSLATAWGGGGGATNNTSAQANPSIRATGGGARAANASPAAGGGGAAQSIGLFTSNSTTPFSNNFGNYQSIGGVLIGNWGTLATDSASVNGTMAGYGIDGYGGGGHGGSNDGDSRNIRRQSVAGGGTAGTFDGLNNGNGTAGTTNTGGGGGGASQNSGGYSMTGGNGGSGFAAIVYWS
jgi:hypothetical protein